MSLSFGALATALHVVAGTVVLAVAPLAIVARQGGAWHRRWGAIFTWGMAGVCASAAVMWQAKGHAFLLALDVVSVYLVVSGWRVLRRHRRGRSAPADLFDVVAALAVIVAGAVLVWMGGTATTPLMRSLATILIALGAVATAFGGLDLVALGIGPRQRYGWFFYHLSAMIAAYVSAVTAFIVINAHDVPMTLRWTVPIGIGTLIITGISARHRLRFARARRLATKALRHRAPAARAVPGPPVAAVPEGAATSR